MIKEKKKRSKYNHKKTNIQIFIEYIKTVLCSILIAIFITSFLTIKARYEMIEDITLKQQNQNLLDKKVALELITKTDLLSNLKNKSYAVCMHAGEICEIANDYKDAQKAYELAIFKSKQNNYKPYYKLLTVLVAQNDFKSAEALLDGISDATNKNLIKFKTRSYLTIGDKLYSIGKFLSAAKSYEKAEFYYNKFIKKDKKIELAIKDRIIKSYIEVADIMVRSGLNSDALRYLKKAEKYAPTDFKIRYKLAIVLSDLNPEISIEYFEKLMKERPQDIDYGSFNTALIKSANIADLDNRPTKAKYYRYKMHSIDLFVNRKVVYANDIEIYLKQAKAKKVLFKYPINLEYEFNNISNFDINNLTADFVLCHNNKNLETITQTIADKQTPLYASSLDNYKVNIKFNQKIYTKKELEQYTVKIYLYKDPKYKTLASENKIYNKNTSKIDIF